VRQGNVGMSLAIIQGIRQKSGTGHTIKSMMMEILEMRTSYIYSLQHALEQFERGYLQNIMVLLRWDREQASNVLGIGREILEAKLERFNLEQE
jgi:DNA-binding NtrC family response regulator